MNRELLSRAFGAIDDRFAAEAYRQPGSGDAPASAEKRRRRRTKRIFTAVLAAALLLALAAAAYASFAGGWLSVYFAERQGKDLSPRQQEYLDRESVTLRRSKTADGYTVTVESILCSRMELCLVVRVEGPEGQKLDHEGEEGGLWFDSIRFKSPDADGQKSPPVGYETSGHHLADGDGRDNTARIVLMHHRDFPPEDPGFADGAVWQVTFTGLYTRAGTVGAGRTVLSEGEWSFELPLTEQTGELEMIASPVSCEALSGGEGEPRDTVGIEVTSFVLRPLGADCAFHLLPGETGVSVEFHAAYLMLKNGDALRLTIRSGDFSRDGSGSGRLYLQPDAPIPLEEVESLILPGEVIVPRPPRS